MNNFLPISEMERIEIRKRVLDNQKLDRISSSGLTRKMKFWLADKMGFEVDYSPYDAEGRPHGEN